MPIRPGYSWWNHSWQCALTIRTNSSYELTRINSYEFIRVSVHAPLITTRALCRKGIWVSLNIKIFPSKILSKTLNFADFLPLHVDRRKCCQLIALSATTLVCDTSVVSRTASRGSSASSASTWYGADNERHSHLVDILWHRGSWDVDAQRYERRAHVPVGLRRLWTRIQNRVQGAVGSEYRCDTLCWRLA